VGPEEIGREQQEQPSTVGAEVRPERVRALAVAQLLLERARASFGREARGCTIQEVDAARQLTGRMLTELEIPLAALPRLGQDQLELILDTYLEHEEGKQG
jgi:hypothetical protein